MSLYVLPERAGRGIGSKLLDVALDALAAEGFERAYLWVLADNVPAPAFYERRGLQLLERENVDEIAGELLRGLLCEVARLSHCSHSKGTPVSKTYELGC